jgi:energy-coupling factor transporter ATP-binding protein EcfA2
MIDRLTISGFKSIAQEVDLPLGRVNVFIGANGSGKSNILEAVGMLSAEASGVVDGESLQRRGVRLSGEGLYLSSFRDKAWDSFSVDMRGVIHIEVQGKAEGYLIDYQVFNEDLAYRKGPLDVSSSWGTSGDPEGENERRAFWRDVKAHFARYRIFSPNTPALRGTEPDRSQADPVGLSGGRLAEATQELLDWLEKAATDEGSEDAEEIMGEVLEMIPWAETLRAVPVGEAVLAREVPAPRTVLEFVDRYMHPDNNRLTAYDASEGVLYVLFALVVALHPRAPKLAAIDNVDQALNPRLARKLMASICAWTRSLAVDRQLLLTVHNPLTLDGLPLDDEGVRLFSVGRNGLGHTTARQISLADVRALKEAHAETLRAAVEKLTEAYGADCAEARALEPLKARGVTLSQLWVTGHLGGMPDV